MSQVTAPTSSLLRSMELSRATHPTLRAIRPPCHAAHWWPNLRLRYTATCTDPPAQYVSWSLHCRNRVTGTVMVEALTQAARWSINSTAFIGLLSAPEFRDRNRHWGKDLQQRSAMFQGLQHECIYRCGKTGPRFRDYSNGLCFRVRRKCWVPVTASNVKFRNLGTVNWPKLQGLQEN